MSVKVSLPELQDQLAELLDRVVQTGEEYVVQRDGKDYAVLISAQQWKLLRLGQRLDAMGPTYRLSDDQQSRAETLLAAQRQRRLSPSEHRELKALLRAADAVLQRRAAALDQLE